MKNVGTADRVARVVVASVLFVAAAVAPVSLVVRLALLFIPGVYMLGTSLVGTCLGYRLMGHSTCPLPRSST